MKYPLSETLQSRTFFGLLLAQFTATFNDQAIHMVAVFYAVDMLVRYAQVPHLDDKGVVSLVTACFITPFLMFSSFAGPLGDRFSKRSVIVFWKVAEVGMMSLALVGLLLPHLVPADSPHLPLVATWSATLVIATVFLMGMHSTFFVPAKLGAMPEILHPSILSRGNGLLEGTSFTAQILGTSFGGIMYALLKGRLSDGHLQPGREWIIGATLLALAMLGTATAVLMQRIPAAAPDRKLSWNWWRPLRENLLILWRSKPLTLSVTGIAFCVFLTLFLRQTLLYQGELQKEYETARATLAREEGRSVEQKPTGVDRLLARVVPPRLEKAAQESELRVALLFALVGLGVGSGSLAAGYLSGHRVELGLVPVGALSIVLFGFLPVVVRSPEVFVCCLFAIGFGAGFYLVPLYTLLQHRAPKESKGNVVSASNFLNVVGGLVAVAMFYVLSFALDRLLGARLTEHDVQLRPEVLPQFVAELRGQLRIPRMLFLSSSVLTMLALLMLVRVLPDFFLRAGIWISTCGHNTLRTVAIENMPLDGPVVLISDCATFTAALDLIAAVDRYPRVILVDSKPAFQRRSWLRKLAERAGLVALPANARDAEWERVERIGQQTLQNGEMVAVTATAADGRVAQILARWREASGAVVVPVHCSRSAGTSSGADLGGSPWPRVVFGPPLEATAQFDAACQAIRRLAPLSDHEAEA